MAMQVGRAAREVELAAHLVYAGDSADLLRYGALNATAMEVGPSGPFATTLNATNLGLWQVLLIVRVVLTLVAWALLATTGTVPAFGVPPYPLSHAAGGTSWTAPVGQARFGTLSV